MRKSLLLLCCAITTTGCELLSGLDDLEFGGGGASPVAGAGQGGAGEGGTGAMAAGGTGGTGGDGAGGMPPLAIDELFIGQSRFACARRGADFFCWGQGLDGAPDMLSPMLTPMPSGTVEFDADSPKCARTGDGELSCWGSNEDGNLGNGTTGAQPQPGPLTQLSSPALAIAVSGYDWACAIVDSSPRSVECWGRNSTAQLSLPADEDPHPLPVTMPFQGPATDVDEVALGFRVGCARLADQVQCWGHNQEGGLGIGTSDGLYYPPTPIATSGPVAQVAVVNLGGCIVSTGEEGFCWGENWGATGDVVAVPPLDGASGIDAGNSHVCGVKNGQAICVGANNRRQLGVESAVASSGVPNVPGEVVQVGAGYDFSCGLTSAGEVYCWGSNFAGALGIGSSSENNFWEPQLLVFPP